MIGALPVRCPAGGALPAPDKQQPHKLRVKTQTDLR